MANKGESDISRSWNISSFLVIIFPWIILFGIATLRRLGDGGEDGQWWNEWGPEANGKVIGIIAYILTLFLFIALAIYGNSVLSQPGKKFCLRGSNDAEKNMGILAGATFTFGIFSFILLLIIGGTLIEFDRLEEIWKQPLFIPITFLLWTIFGIVFGILLSRRGSGSGEDSSSRDRSSKDKSSKFSLFRGKSKKSGNREPLV